MTVRRVTLLVLGLLLVVAGITGFVVLDGVPADVVCLVAAVSGLVVLRAGSRPGPGQIA